MSDVMERIVAFMENLPDPATVPARLLVDQLALARLRQLAHAPERQQHMSWGGPALYGIPIDEVELPADGPGAWRLVNRDGDVLKMGNVR